MLEEIAIGVGVLFLILILNIKREIDKPTTNIFYPILKD